MSKIGNQLQLVAKGEPVYWRTVLNAFHESDFTTREVELIMEPELKGAKKTRVNILNAKEFEILIREYPVKDLSSKANASVTGHSHEKSSPGGLISLFIPGSEKVISVYSLDGDSWFPALEKSIFQHNVVVVENETNFIYHSQTISFINRWCSADLDEDNTVLALGSGTHALKSDIKAHMAKFKSCYVLPDLDLAGINIAERALTGIDNAHSILIPTNFDQLLKTSGWKLAKNERVALTEKVESLQHDDRYGLIPLLKAMLLNNRKIEQEIYLLSDYE